MKDPKLRARHDEPGASCPHCGGELPAHLAPPPRGRGSSPLVIGLVLGLLGILVVGLGVTALGWFTLRQRAEIQKSLGRAEHAKTRADLTVLRAALEEYALQNDGAYPEDIEVLFTPDEHGRRFINRDTVPVDVWGNTYLYDPPDWNRMSPRIYTLGADGVPGGEGENADLDDLTVGDDR